MKHERLSPEVLACIKTCGECASMCAQTAQHCLHLGGEHASPEHQCLMQDCKQICDTAVDFMSRSSPYATDICRECVEICAACAVDCDRIADGDKQMKDCAQTCRKCAKECEKMAGATV